MSLRYCIKWKNSRGEIHQGPALSHKPENIAFTHNLPPENLEWLPDEPTPYTIEEALMLAAQANATVEFHNKTHEAIPCR